MKATSVVAIATVTTTRKSTKTKASSSNTRLLHQHYQYSNRRSFLVVLILFNIVVAVVVVPYFASVVTVAAMSTSSSSNNSAAAAEAAVAKNTIDFLTMARGLKTTPRTGWVLQQAGPRIESVADHSWRIGLMAMVAASSSSAVEGSSSYDSNRCIKMALVHDLAEATVGDITPHCGVSDDDKHARELLAISEMTQKLTSSLPGMSSTSPVGQEILGLWKEYEAGVTEEAKLVKDMDKLEMILQALEYETDGKNQKSLDGFFDGTRGKWRTPIGEAWGKEIEGRRRCSIEVKGNSSSSSKNNNEEEPSAATQQQQQQQEEEEDSKPPAEKKTKL